jgi:hypothetical protein
MQLSGRDRRMLTIAGSVVAGIVVMAVAFGLLRDDPDEHPRAVGLAPLPVSTAPTTAPARVLSDRDPFSPPPALQTANPSPSLDDRPPGSVEPVPTGTGSVSTPPTSTPPSTTPPTTTSPAPPPDCGSARPSECRRVGANVIVLLRVLSRHPRPSVDLELDGDLVTNVRQGDRFGDGFKLVGFNDSLCPRIVFGEEGFTLCERDGRA